MAAKKSKRRTPPPRRTGRAKARIATERRPRANRATRDVEKLPQPRELALASPPEADASDDVHQRTMSIVGIGASAGGLEALTTVFRLIPPATGMAFVVVQHLLPSHESALAAILGKSTRLPVIQVAEGMPLQPDQVHVIPPNTQMTVIHGRLHLAPRRKNRAQHTPINTFFRSLGVEADGHGIGIVLSGSGSDGADGLRDIKAAGGLAIAQDPKTAQSPDMPRAAIATGVVDLVLSPERIAEELTRVSGHPFLQTTRDVAESTFNPSQLGRLFYALRTVSNVDFTHYKMPTIRRRVLRRMALHRLVNFEDYLQTVERDPVEAKKLYRDILIHVTRFFRDPDSFEALTKTVFPRIIHEAAGKRPIRIWVPGCATGEEPYSIAIALLEYMGGAANAIPMQVFGTDISDEAIERARSGLYPETIATDVSPERLRRFFTRSSSHYRINKLVRDSCIFARQDLTRDPPFSKLDLIVCRNVLIYLGPRLQRKLVSLFHYSLKPAGFLMLGSNESIGTQGELFAIVDRRHKIYTRRAAAVTGTIELPRPGENDERSGTIKPVRTLDGRDTAADMRSEITRVLVNRYSPPAVVVDQDFQVMQTRGKTGMFLELTTGEASLNILKLAREGLVHGLRAALHEARRTAKPARREGLLVRASDVAREVTVQVVPLGNDSESLSLLVLFEDTPPAKPAAAMTRKAAKLLKATDTGRELQRLHQELASSRDYSQSIIQDLEAANEQLQSANEEILSSNEELQSTNEELDTAKEELQSTNEELNTVNDELNARNEELTQLNSDLMNLLTAVPAAIVIVSAQLRIRRFTPLAESLLNLIASDVGRPLSDIKPNVDVGELADMTRQVIETMIVAEREVRDRQGRFYALRIRPYKSQDHRIDGAVIAFVDVDAARRRQSPIDEPQA